MARNEELPGVEGEGVSPVKIKAVDTAFDELLGHRTRRMKAGKAEQEASANLIALFKKHNLKTYYFDDVKYVIMDKEKVVRAPKDEDEVI